MQVVVCNQAAQHLAQVVLGGTQTTRGLYTNYGYGACHLELSDPVSGPYIGTPVYSKRSTSTHCIVGIWAEKKGNALMTARDRLQVSD